MMTTQPTTHQHTCMYLKGALSGDFTKGSTGINCGYAVFAFCRNTLLSPPPIIPFKGENRVEWRGDDEKNASSVCLYEKDAVLWL